MAITNDVTCFWAHRHCQLLLYAEISEVVEELPDDEEAGDYDDDDDDDDISSDGEESEVEEVGKLNDK